MCEGSLHAVVAVINTVADVVEHDWLSPGEKANLKLRALELRLAVNMVVPSSICSKQVCALWVFPLFLHDIIPKFNIYSLFFL